LAGPITGLTAAGTALETERDEVEEEVQALVGDLEDEFAPSTVSSGAENEAGGSATIMQHPGQPVHFSIGVSGADGTLQTHQVITSLDGSATSIVNAADISAGDVVRSGTLDLPNATAAMERQSDLIGAGNIGPYDAVLNSCVSHVSYILSAGGIETPAAQGSAQLRFLLSLLKGG
jgi:hypothetical protein